MMPGGVISGNRGFPAFPTDAKFASTITRAEAWAMLRLKETRRLRAEMADPHQVGSCACHPTRRVALLGAASGLLLPSIGRAQPAASTNPRRIDVHHHIVPPVYLERARAQLVASFDTDPQPVLGWTPQKALEEMDKYGVATALTSVSTPGIWFGDARQAADLAHACNEYAARLAADHPGRFGVLAALPLPDQDASLKEIEYVFDTLKADGICLLTSYDGKWPGDPAFRPVMDELNRRKAVLYFHPTAPACCVNLVPDVAPSTVEFLFDSTRALLSMMASGTLTRCPDIKCIFAHTGGATTDIAYRINAYFARHKEMTDRLPHGAMYEIKRQHYDIANSVNPSTMAAALNLFGTGQLLFGSDNPFVPLSLTAALFDKFEMSPDQKQAINRETALKLFPRYAST
jgi:predicted TIM-barrel fold metal-dependent hydrolase